MDFKHRIHNIRLACQKERTTVKGWARESCLEPRSPARRLQQPRTKCLGPGMQQCRRQKAECKGVVETVWTGLAVAWGWRIRNGKPGQPLEGLA